MKAIRIEEFGGPEVMELVDVPDPEPGEGEVVVEVARAGPPKKQQAVSAVAAMVTGADIIPGVPPPPPPEGQVIRYAEATR